MTTIEAPPQMPNLALAAQEREQITTLEQEHVDTAFSRMVTDLELDSSIEQAPAEKAVLSLAAECWAATDTMPSSQAAQERNWLVEVTLRGVGGKSRYVREHGLVDYHSEANETEIANNTRVVSEYQTSEMSTELKKAIPGIMDEFHFDKKFPQGVDPSELAFVVVPQDAPPENRIAHGASGALIDLPDGRKGIMISEQTYRGAIENGSAGSRSLIAHEVGHSVQTLVVGEGAYPLGHMVNELYAEWSGDNKGMYFDEKHMSNLLSLTGFDLRNNYIPKLASGELNMADLIGDLKQTFGSRNALRLLAYAPTNYDVPGAESPAEILQDCVDFALSQGQVTQQQLTERLADRYKPNIANIMVTNANIRRIIPANLYSSILDRARQDQDFNEAKLAQ